MCVCSRKVRIQNIKDILKQKRKKEKYFKEKFKWMSVWVWENELWFPNEAIQYNI